MLCVSAPALRTMLPLLREAGEGREGAARWCRRTERIQDDSIDAVRIVHDFIVPESEDAPASRLDLCIACAIGTTSIMANAISFDSESRRETGKIHNEWWNRMLAPEVPAIELLPSKDLPELSLSRRRLLTQASRLVANGCPNSWHRMCLASPDGAFAPSLTLPRFAEEGASA